MPTRILKYLDEMDILRESSNEAIDAMIARIKPRALLMQDRQKNVKMFKLLYLQYLKDNGNLFTKARKEGEKLAKSL